MSVGRAALSGNSRDCSHYGNHIDFYVVPFVSYGKTMERNEALKLRLRTLFYLFGSRSIDAAVTVFTCPIGKGVLAR